VTQRQNLGLMDRVRHWVRHRVRVARVRWPWFGHAARAFERNDEVRGSQLAAAVTYFGFLSFFPLLALGFAVVGYLSDGDPHVQQQVTDAVENAFPGLVGSGEGSINIQDVIDAKAGAGIIGLLGLLYAGLGWIDAVREALQRVFGTSAHRIGFVKKKIVDVLVLGALGVAVLSSIAVTSLATRVTQQVLDVVGIGESQVATVALKVLAVALALLADTVLIAILLSRLSGARLPWRQVRSGALVAAVGFEILKLVATFLIAKTTTNPIYATFGVIVGLLVWINFVSKLLVVSAAWAATQPGAVAPVSVLAGAPDEVVPAGTTSPDAGPSRRRGWRKALIGAAAGAGLAATLTRRRHKP
jgi:membrane protein